MCRLITSVRCSREAVTHAAVSYSVALDTASIARIKALSCELKKSNDSQIATSDTCGVWSSEPIDDYQSFNDVTNIINETPVSIEGQTLRVTTSSFSWSCTPTHGSKAIAFTTANIPLSYLDNDNETSQTMN